MRMCLFRTIACVYILLILAPCGVEAANHALLIGVGEYKRIDESYWLQGPPYDVSALRDALETTWGFKPDHITTLVNDEARRERILGELAALDGKTRPGDSLFIYFSGHGVSAHDPKSEQLGLGPFTGALAPADFKFGSPDEMRKRLIIGARDLRPVFETLEKNHRLLVVFDTCYSGYAVRALHGAGKDRALPVEWEDLTEEPPGEFGASTLKTPEYPYNNVVYLSASSMREIAVDITAEDIKNGVKTMDGNPHGAFTNALLKGLRGAADTDHDNVITPRELYSHAREEVSRRFLHTPGMLYPEKNRGLINQPVFGGRIIKKTPGGILAPNQELRVKIEGLDPPLARRIAGVDGLKVVTRGEDIRISRERDAYRLHLSNGYPLASIPVRDPGQLTARLARQVKIKELVGFSAKDQRFNIFVELTGPDGVLVEGDEVGFRVGVDVDSYLLLINIDPTGFINVIYPYTSEELAERKANEDLRLPEMGVVQPPFGVEYIKAFAFKRRPDGLVGLVGGEFDPMDDRFSALMDLIRACGGDAAQTTIQVKTCAKADIVKITN